MLYKLTWEEILDEDYAPLDFNAFSYSYLDLEDDGFDRPQTDFYKLTNGEMR